MTRTSLVLVPVLTVLALLGAGCGGGGDTPTATDTVTATVTQTVTATPTEATPSESATSTPSDTTSASPVSDDIPRTYDAALARFDALGQEPARYRTFATPDGDIYCVLDDKAITPGCEIGDGAIRDPDVCGDAPTPFVGRIEFQGGRATPVCNLDSIRGDMPNVLHEDEAARAGDVQCLYESIGMTCISLSNTEGFFLRPGEYVIFNAG
jgi:hypothetical protein